MKFFGMRTLMLISFALAAFDGRGEKVSSIPQPAGYVDDYAGVISNPTKAQLENLCRELHDKTKAQVFFVTVKTLDGEAVETFANELFAKWKIGEKKTDRGVLLLLATSDRKRWIEVGYGFEGILNDAKVGDIGRAMVPPLKAENYDEAAKIGIDDVSRVIATDAGVSLTGTGNSDAIPVPRVPTDAPGASKTGTTQWDWLSLAGPALVFIVVGIAIWRIRKNQGSQSGPGTAAGTSFDSGFSSENFGSNFSSGTGSDSFSGGDGGSSGGGGAGGDW